MIQGDSFVFQEFECFPSSDCVLYLPLHSNCLFTSYCKGFFFLKNDYMAITPVTSELNVTLWEIHLSWSVVLTWQIRFV